MYNPNRHSVKTFNSKELYVYYDLNHNNLFATNDKYDPAFPFICERYKKGVQRYNKHNLCKILSSNGEFMNEKQIEEIKRLKIELIGEDTVGAYPKTIEQSHVIELLARISQHITREQIMTIISNFEEDYDEDIIVDNN